MVAEAVGVAVVVGDIELRRHLAERRARNRVRVVIGPGRARYVVHGARAALREPRRAE